MIKEVKEALVNFLSDLKSKESFDKVYSNSEIKVSDKVVGAKVELIGKDGALSPAPDGDYQLEDGTKFTVKDSMIDSIEGEEMAQEPVEGNPAEEATETPKEEAQEDAEMVAMKQSIADLQAEIATLKSTVEELKNGSASKEDATQFGKQLQDLTDTIKALANIPAEFSKTNNKPSVKDEKEEKMNDLARVFASLKTK